MKKKKQIPEQNFSRYLSLLLLGCVVMSCHAETEGRKENWGLKSIEFKQKLEFKETPYELEFLFEPRKTSKKYELRMFYPSIGFDETSTRFGSIKKTILESLNGFEYTIYDVETNEVIKNYSVDFSGSFRGYSFNENTPLSLWMGVKFELEKNRKYRILLRIPPKRNAEEMYSDAVYVVGIAHDVFL